MQPKSEIMEIPENESLEDQLKKIKAEVTNLRRGLFGRYDKLLHEYTSLQEKINEIQFFVRMPMKDLTKEEDPSEEMRETKILQISSS